MADTRQPRFNARHRSAGIVRFGMWDEINHAMVCLVDPKLVAIDPRFQRDHDKRHSGGMALKRPHVVPYPVCNYSTTTNELDAVDGQHRVEAAKTREDRRMWVLVKFNMTLAEKADCYVELNKSKRPDRWNTFLACLTAGHADYQAMKNVADRYGMTLKCHDRRADLRCTEPMLEANKIGQFENWIKLLSCFMVDGRLEKQASTNAIEFQRGLIDLLRKYGPEVVCSQRFLNGLRQIGVALIVEQANAICECSRTNQSHYYQAIDGLCQARNLFRGLRAA